MRFPGLFLLLTLLDIGCLSAQADGRETSHATRSADPSDWVREQTSPRPTLWAIPGAHEPAWRGSGVFSGVPTTSWNQRLAGESQSGAATGFMVGALLGGVLMFVSCISTYDCPVGIMTLAAAAGGGLLGAVIGAAADSDIRMTVLRAPLAFAHRGGVR